MFNRSYVWLVFGLCLLIKAPVWADAKPNEREAWLRHLLTQDCGSCHGMTLNGGLGPALTPEALMGKPDAMLVDTILSGRLDTAMPPWEGILDRADAEWLVRYLRQGPTAIQE